MSSKRINWPAIKKRYLQGDKPKDIAAQFGLTASQVSQKAKRENWKPKKAKIAQKTDQKIEKAIESELDKFDAIFGGLILGFGHDLLRQRADGTMGLTIHDGEAFINPLARDALKAGFDLYKERQKQKSALPPVASQGKPTPITQAIQEGADLEGLFADHEPPIDTLQQEATEDPDVVASE